MKEFDALDNDGYPTEEYLQFIKAYEGQSPIMDFIAILMDGWWCNDWGFVLHRKYKGVRKMELHTGGWSGNEDIIEALHGAWNGMFWFLYWQKSTRGGHYYFTIPMEE